MMNTDDIRRRKKTVKEEMCRILVIIYYLQKQIEFVLKKVNNPFNDANTIENYHR